jgi:hypothetical protein
VAVDTSGVLNGLTPSAVRLLAPLHRAWSG